MAKALCSHCRQEITWYAGRGRRLSSVVTRCCNSTAVAPATRTGHRGDPAVKAEVRLGDYEHEPGGAQSGESPVPIVQLWRTSVLRVALLKDGRVQFGKSWRRYLATDQLEDGWRHFTCPRTDVHNFYCKYEDRAMMREDDYQRLLAKTRPASGKQVVQERR